MTITITRKENGEVAFRLQCAEYSTFYAACTSIADRFDLPLPRVKEWVNAQPADRLIIPSDKFLLELIPTVGHRE